MRSLLGRRFDGQSLTTGSVPRRVSRHRRHTVRSVGYDRGRRSFPGIRLLPGIALACQLWGAAQACAAETIVIRPEQVQLVGIETAELGEAVAPAALRFPARVLLPPNQTHIVSAPVSGRLVRIGVAADQPVRQGQLLAEIEGPEVARAQTEFLQAVQREQLLRGTAAREQKLAPDQIVPQKQLLATRNEHLQAQAVVAERRQALLMMGMTDAEIDALAASRSLRATIIVAAPMDSVVLEMSVVPGQKVETMAPLYKLARFSPLWLELQVPVAQAARFADGDAMTIVGSPATAHVVAIGRTADPGTQSVTVRAETTDAPTGLRPGQFVEARVTLRSSGELRWNVRPEAVVRRGQEAYVFVQAEDGFRPEPVAVHEETAEITVISGSLQKGERIAVRGLVALKGAWQGLGGQSKE